MSNDQENLWVLRWDRHPTKRVYFRKEYDTFITPYIRMWGVGFQGLDDPPPKLHVPNTSIGDWEVDLNNEETSYSIGIDFARELWDRMIEAGWSQDFRQTPF